MGIQETGTSLPSVCQAGKVNQCIQQANQLALMVLIDLTADYSDDELEVDCLGMTTTQSDNCENRELKMAVITPDPVN